MKWAIRERPKSDPSLTRLATILRAADTNTLDQSPEAPGLLAISLGLNVSIDDDQVLLTAALPLYDALYALCAMGRRARHDWRPEDLRQEIVS